MSDDVGARLRALRTLRGISQRELAKRCGVTHSSLSLIEQGKVSPSVSSLKKILDAIPMSVGDFFTMDLESKNQVFYSADELTDVGSGDVIFKLVGANRDSRALSFMIETYPPGSDTGREMITHQGEEAGVILEGAIEITIGAETRMLAAGEAYYFDTNVPHRFRNPGKEACRLVSCATPARTF
ncbi:cupin domain-containing protein [Halomonas denitrificans]|uniref:cupin domain-containing protein n=1 Tax=Halomonas TaxID=2745 RepID=UPI001A8DD7B5|nr:MULTISPECIES: cupin domain-containing protein [Halomonas]MED5295692.1 cupin domain-containing protein [Pseudomonadota bacterium]MBN8413533.1 cupin domain-containing protein [Halomonas litopenaei]MBY5926131.1 cupin domain-containing protein [Halomonas sp. DP4Y7-2]MBY5931170.1 cupin domain-containing protein [Halomonas sp. DP8Y7-3]MBY5969070.1 cupin domain-containing protein [Halomonas denitrificans]